ncbi:MAG: PadR family transcriptional regulator [Anaerolineaceae bacterium]|nr:PadR family transcriptional regulator [Anaerolineaceae bacterium]
MISTLNANLPLTEVTFYILLSLAQAPRHGYAIMKDVHNLSDGRLDLTAGTLYGAIKRLVEQGWIQRYDDGQPDETGRPRKVYRLMGQGQEMLTVEIRRLQSQVRAAGRLALGG